MVGGQRSVTMPVVQAQRCSSRLNRGCNGRDVQLDRLGEQLAASLCKKKRQFVPEDSLTLENNVLAPAPKKRRSKKGSNLSISLAISPSSAIYYPSIRIHVSSSLNLNPLRCNPHSHSSYLPMMVATASTLPPTQQTTVTPSTPIHLRVPSPLMHVSLPHLRLSPSPLRVSPSLLRASLSPSHAPLSLSHTLLPPPH